MTITWDFEKGLLAFMALLILAGIGVIVWQRGRADDLRSAQPRAENQLARIGQTSQEIQGLKQEILADEMAQGMQPFDYLDKQMVESKIGKKFKITPRNITQQTGFFDQVWEVKPEGTGLTFDRRALGVFLIHIEAKTKLMKVTRIKLDVSSKRGTTGDDWTPLIEVTERRAS